MKTLTIDDMARAIRDRKLPDGWESVSWHCENGELTFHANERVKCEECGQIVDPARLTLVVREAK